MEILTTFVPRHTGTANLSYTRDPSTPWKKHVHARNVYAIIRKFPVVYDAREERAGLCGLQGSSPQVDSFAEGRFVSFNQENVTAQTLFVKVRLGVNSYIRYFKMKQRSSSSSDVQRLFVYQKRNKVARVDCVDHSHMLKFSGINEYGFLINSRQKHPSLKHNIYIIIYIYMYDHLLMERN